MIWDTFLFAAELDVLDMRLATLETYPARIRERRCPRSWFRPGSQGL